MGPQYKYTVDLIAQTKQFEQNMQNAATKANQLAGATGSVATGGNKLNSSLGMMASGLGKLGLMIGGPVAALSLLKSSIQAIEGPGDKFEEIMGGGKEALFEFQKALVTMDFSGFFSNLKEGFERGKEFAAALDKLADQSAYNDYIVAGLRAQSYEIQETIKNKTLDISVRTKAGEERRELEQKILDRTQELAKKAFLIEKQQWEGRNKMATEGAIKLYETIDSYSSEIQTRMSDAFKQAKGEFSPRTGLDTLAKRVKSILPDINVGAINLYKDYLKLLKEGEADVLPKLFNAYKNIDVVRAESQRTFNMVIRETTMLLEGEERAMGKVVIKAGEISKISGLKPGVGSIAPGAIDKLAGGPRMPKQDAAKKAEGELRNYLDTLKILNNLDDPFTFINESITKLTGNLMEGADSFKEYANNIINSVKSIIGALLAESVATAITTALKAATFAGPAGVFLIPALAALGGGLARTAFNSLIPEFAEGALAYGPTIAQVGEYPGARSNPEVIAPLSKLERMLQPTVAEGKVVFRIEGRELVGILQRETRVSRNIRGR